MRRRGVVQESGEKGQVRGGGEGGKQEDRAVKQSEWLIAWGGEAGWPKDHNWDHTTTEPALSSAMLNIQTGPGHRHTGRLCSDRKIL